MKFRTNTTSNIDGKHIKERLSQLKPDIIAWDQKHIKMAEFSCPYANVGEQGNKLTNVFNEKKDKYKELVQECERVYKRKVKLYVIIVSSLGAIQKQSIDDIKKLLKISASDNKLLSTILRRLSLAACIGSYFIYNKFKLQAIEVDTNDNTNECKTQDEANASVEQHAEETISEETNEEAADRYVEEDVNIGPNSSDNEEEYNEEDEEENEEGSDPIADAGHEEAHNEEAGVTDGSIYEEGDGCTSANTANNNSDAQRSHNTA